MVNDKEKERAGKVEFSRQKELAIKMFSFPFLFIRPLHVSLFIVDSVIPWHLVHIKGMNIKSSFFFIVPVLTSANQASFFL